MKSSKFTYTDADEFIITPPKEDRAQPKQERSVSDYDGEPEVTDDDN